mmetsp:Transcript_12087/g.24618  ORF Transcript_12087/g.24618 Transcript_12087/m.24618 type:complete len:99 (+) Transcript_12087:612-908(+)
MARGGLYTSAADVYSFGQLLQEIFFPASVCVDLDTPQCYSQVDSTLPNMVPETPDPVKSLIDSCTQEMLSARPTFQHIIEVLRQNHATQDCPAMLKTV